MGADNYFTKSIGVVSRPSHVEHVDYIKQLREKLEADPVRPRYLLTETGVGYRLVGEEVIRRREIVHAPDKL
jgi:hypothetical protein